MAVASSVAQRRQRVVRSIDHLFCDRLATRKQKHGTKAVFFDLLPSGRCLAVYEGQQREVTRTLDFTGEAALCRRVETCLTARTNSAEIVQKLP
jgi:hypothetical protein